MGLNGKCWVLGNNGLKIRVSAVRTRPVPPLLKASSRDALLGAFFMAEYCGGSNSRFHPKDV